MRHNTFLGIALSISAMGIAYGASEVWNQDYRNWSSSDVQKVLTNSPWAAKTAASYASENRGGGYDPNSSGGSYPGSGSGNGGGGYPNSGGGYPGGGGGMGGRGGGMGGMGGGMGGMGGGMGGMGGGRGRRGGQDQSQMKMDVVVRWDSSMPVKQALLKSESGGELPAPGDPKYTLDKPEKDYVISVVGMRAMRSRSNDSDADDDSKSSASDHMRNLLMSSTQILIKNKEALNPDDVKIEPQSDGTNTATFFFSRSNPIDLDDKEVTFVTQTGRLKIERKFKLKEMVYNGKLSL